MIGRSFESLDDAYKWVVAAITQDGESVAPRAFPTKEIRAIQFSIENPRRRYVSLGGRRWSFPYALGEFCWHARGSDKLAEIEFYASRWKQMSSDGRTIEGSSYGAKIFGGCATDHSQWSVAKRLLFADPDSRRAVLSFAGPLDEKRARGADASCATSLQFSVRSGKLEAVVSMRSNDAILGLPYDVFLFTMLQEMMAVELQIGLGTYHHFVGSMHIYESDLGWADEIDESVALVTEPMPLMSTVAGLQDLLSGENHTRNGRQLEPGREPPDGYWSDLLTVLRYRNAIQHDVHPAVMDAIPNPLYRRLTSLHKL